MDSDEICKSHSTVNGILESHQHSSRVICIAEDRPACEPGIQVLIASLAKHCPDASIHLFAPNATETLRFWLTKYKQVTLDTIRISSTARGWDIKPSALLFLLSKGYFEAIWIDSDIVICRDFRSIFANLDPEVLVIAEEGPGPFRADGEAERCKLWGFKVGRTFPHVLNTCVLRVTPTHRELLESWENLIQTSEYQKQQKMPWDQRQLHMLGDQDVLTALLAATQFVCVPLLVLARGRHIIQFFLETGYCLKDRLYHIFRGMPPFVHSQGWKPWIANFEKSGRFMDSWKLYADLSPYTMIARRYRQYISCDKNWMNAHSKLSRGLRILGAYYPPLVGLPLLAVFSLRRGINAILSRT